MNGPTIKIFSQRILRAIEVIDDMPQDVRLANQLSEVRHSLRHQVNHLIGEVAPGRCRICGCTEDFACSPPCTWADADQTLCSNPACVKLAAGGGEVRR